MTAAHKLGLLGALYLAQGLPFGFFSQALPVLLRQQGVDLEHIGLASLLALPWAAKALWAPLVERMGSPRRTILALQAVAVALSVGLSTVDPTAGVSVLVVAVLLTNFVAATQDIVTDGLAVRLLSGPERGLGNGVQVGGYRVGMVLGGGALLMAYDTLGWTGTLLCMASLLALTAAPLWLSEDVGTAPPAQSVDTWTWLRQPGALAWCAVLVAFKLGDYLAQGMLRPWLVDLGWSMSDLGALLGLGGFGAGLLGAALGGIATSRLPMRAALIAFGLLQCTGSLAYAVVAASTAPAWAVWGAVLWEHLVGGFATVALFTAMMNASREEHAGTDYTLQAGIVVAASGLGATPSGYLAVSLGFSGLFALSAVLGLAAPIAAALIAVPRLSGDEP